MTSFIRVFDKVDYFLFFIAKIAVFVMMVLTSLDALFRYLFTQPIIGAYDFTERYLMVAVVFLSMSYVWKLNGHVRMELIIERLPHKVVVGLNMLYNLLGCVFMILIGYEAMLLTIDAWVNQYVSAGIIPWPTWASVIFVPIGAYMFAIRLFVELISYIIEIWNSSNPIQNKKLVPNDEVDSTPR